MPVNGIPPRNRERWDGRVRVRVHFVSLDRWCRCSSCWSVEKQKWSLEKRDSDFHWRVIEQEDCSLVQPLNSECRWSDDPWRQCRAKQGLKRCSLQWHNREDLESEHADWLSRPDDDDCSKEVEWKESRVENSRSSVVVQLPRRRSRLKRTERDESVRRSGVTLNGIIFDFIFIEPVRTRNGEHCARRAIQRMDRTRSVVRRSIDHEVQRTRTRRHDETIRHFKAPQFDRRILDEQTTGRCEITAVSSYTKYTRSVRICQNVVVLTKEINVLEVVCLIESNPLCEIEIWIEETSIDVPSNVEKILTVADAQCKESDLSCWID